MNIIPYSELDITILPGNHKRGSVVERACSNITYGQFPPNNFGFPVGDIVLKLGYCGFGPSKKGATGLRHIWDKHHKEIGLSCPSEIPCFIETVIKQGSSVLIDHGKSTDKPLVLSSSTGMAILCQKVSQNRNIYEIITAYTRRQHPGTVIATL